MIARIFRPTTINYGGRCYTSAARASEIYKTARKCLVVDRNDGYMVKSPYEPVELPSTTVDRYVWNNISKWSNHIAIECSMSGRKYTYGELKDHSSALAIRLRRKLGLMEDDLVAICLPNVPEYPIALFGALEANLGVTTINPTGTVEELAFQLRSCKPKLIFCPIKQIAQIEQIVQLASLQNVKIVAVKTSSDESYPVNCIHFNELINITGLNLTESSKFNDNANLDKAVILPYSSGTTGLQKGVMHTHSTMIANSEVLSAKMFDETIISSTTAEHQEVVSCFLPFYHAYGLTVLMLNKFSLGCKIISIPNYQPNKFVDIVKKHRVTFLPLVPPVVVSLNNFEGARSSDFESVRGIMCGASNLAEEDVKRFMAKNTPNSKFTHAYGLTEGILTFSPKETENYASIGWPLSRTDIKIAKIDDSNFLGLPAHEIGEVIARGPTVMTGYFNNEEATKATLIDGGWIRTGDIGYYDENGMFYICDRLKELIKVNAEQVAPAELEGILREHSDILEAAVIGISHDKCGEVPKAFVVRRPGSAVNERQIAEFVAKRVTRNKQLSGGVQFIDAIPKSASGKMLRREIKRLHQ